MLLGKNSLASESRPWFFQNDFNSLRLIAALQVAVFHGIEHLNHSCPVALFQALGYVPGVPIFFLLSGYLISSSWERCATIHEYFIKRAIRIFPALWVCLAITIFCINVFDDITWEFWPTLLWLFAQSTFMQFYTPECLRGFGLGVPNGSLWTIAVELQFYFLVPIIYWVLNRTAKQSMILILLFILFSIANSIFSYFRGLGVESLIFKLVGVSFIPWVYLFVLGVLLQRNQNFVRRYIAGKSFIWLVVYIVVIIVSGLLGLVNHGNYMNPLASSCLGILCIALAYQFRKNPLRKILQNDLSYGLYLYHGLIINVFIQTEWSCNAEGIAIMILLSLFLAALSWFTIERPAMVFTKRLLLNKKMKFC